MGLGAHLDKAVFVNKDRAGFSSVVKQRVHAYFQERGRSKHANAQMYAKSVFYLGGMVALYTLLLFGGLGTAAIFGVMWVMGMFLAFIGFNVGHDAIHRAYSSKRWVNKLLSYSFELLGACTYTWRIRHNLIHHTFTNIIDSDGDLDSTSLLRFCVRDGRKWYHRYQHFYAPLLYALTSFSWVIRKDFLHIFEEKRDQRLGKPPPMSAYITLFGFKALHLSLFIVIPIVVLNLPIWQGILLFMVMHAAAGLTLALVFQLGHCVEGPEFIPPADPTLIEDPWAEHQVRTSANFGKGLLATFFCGGLNYQIEHHLFPMICHVHYRQISKIVKATAEEYHIPYTAYPTFWSALRSHFAVLKQFGRTDPVAMSASSVA